MFICCLINGIVLIKQKYTLNLGNCSITCQQSLVLCYYKIQTSIKLVLSCYIDVKNITIIHAKSGIVNGTEEF